MHDRCREVWFVTFDLSIALDNLTKIFKELEELRKEDDDYEAEDDDYEIYENFNNWISLVEERDLKKINNFLDGDADYYIYEAKLIQNE